MMSRSSFLFLNKEIRSEDQSQKKKSRNDDLVAEKKEIKGVPVRRTELTISSSATRPSQNLIDPRSLRRGIILIAEK